MFPAASQGPAILRGKKLDLGLFVTPFDSQFQQISGGSEDVNGSTCLGKQLGPKSLHDAVRFLFATACLQQFQQFADEGSLPMSPLQCQERLLYLQIGLLQLSGSLPDAAFK